MYGGIKMRKARRVGFGLVVILVCVFFNNVRFAKAESEKSIIELQQIFYDGLAKNRNIDRSSTNKGALIAAAKENAKNWNELATAQENSRSVDILRLEIPAGVYDFSGQIRVVSNLVIETKEATGTENEELAKFMFLVNGKHGRAGFSNIMTEYGVTPVSNFTMRHLAVEYDTVYGPKLGYTEANFLGMSSLIEVADSYSGTFNKPASPKNKAIYIEDVQANGHQVGKSIIYLASIQDGSVKNSSIIGSGYLNGIQMEYSTNIQLENNRIQDIGRSGIQLFRGNHDIFVYGNTVIDWMQRYGAYHYYNGTYDTPMFDAAIDSYGPDNTKLRWENNKVYANLEGDILDNNPSNDLIVELNKSNTVNVSTNGNDEKKTLPIPTVAHTYYLPFRLSGASDAEVVHNEVKINSKDTFGFVFIANRPIKLKDGTIIGLPSNVIVKDNEMTISGQSRFPLRVIGAKKTDGIGVEFFNNNFTVNGIIHHAGRLMDPEKEAEQKEANTYSPNPEFTTIRYSKDVDNINQLTYDTEEVVLANNHIIHNTLFGKGKPVSYLAVSNAATGLTLTNPILGNLIYVNNRLVRKVDNEYEAKDKIIDEANQGKSEEDKEELGRVFNTISDKNIKENHSSVLGSYQTNADGILVFNTNMTSPVYQIEIQYSNGAMPVKIYSPTILDLVKLEPTTMSANQLLGTDFKGNLIEKRTIYNNLSKDVSITASFNLSKNQITGTTGSKIVRVSIWSDGKKVMNTTPRNGSYTFSNVNSVIGTTSKNIQIIAEDAKAIQHSLVELSN